MSKSKKEAVLPAAASQGAAISPFTRHYNIKRYSRAGRSYAAQHIETEEHARTELKRLADIHKAAGRAPAWAADGLAFTVDEGEKGKPFICEYKIL